MSLAEDDGYCKGRDIQIRALESIFRTFHCILTLTSHEGRNYSSRISINIMLPGGRKSNLRGQGEAWGSALRPCQLGVGSLWESVWR